jgi:hypothetical protein
MHMERTAQKAAFDVMAIVPSCWHESVVNMERGPTNTHVGKQMLVLVYHDVLDCGGGP